MPFLSLSLVTTVLLSCASAFTPPRPCQAYPTKVSRLSACSTASAFCSSYLGGPASFTRTTYTTTYVPSSTDVVPAATPLTSTVTGSTVVTTGIVTETDSRSITTVGYVSTVTTTANSCSISPSPNGGLVRRAKSSKPANTYCGITSTMQTAEISGACNCYLASKTLVTSTVTMGVATSESTGVVTATTVNTIETAGTTTVTPVSTVSTVSSVSTQYIPPIELPRATAIATPANGYDDDTYALSIPFEISFFGVSSSNLVVGINGFVALKGGVVQQGSGTYYQNGPLPEYGYSYSSLPDTTIAPFWDDLVINAGTQQGLYYQLNGDTPGERTLQIEWFTSQYQDEVQYYHFLGTFPEATSDGVTFEYFQILDNGRSATVGAQSQTANMVSQFSFNQPIITCGTILTYNEATNSFIPSRALS